MFRSESCEHKMRSSCTKIDRRYFCLPRMTREENSWGLVITIPCRSLRSGLFVFVVLSVKGRRSKAFNVNTLYWTRKQNNTIQKESLWVRINDRQKNVFFSLRKIQSCSLYPIISGSNEEQPYKHPFVSLNS